MLQWSRMARAQTAAGRTMSLTKNAVSLLARHSPVAAERVRVSRLTRISARAWPPHPRAGWRQRAAAPLHDAARRVRVGSGPGRRPGGRPRDDRRADRAL